VLESLLLSYNAIGALGSTLLATALRDNARLRLLDLSHNRIGRDGVRPWIGSTLRVNRALLELRLSHNSIGDAKASELLDALAPKPVSQEEMLKSQIARRRHTTAVVPSVVAHSMPVSEPDEDNEPFNSSVTTLLLADTGIGDEAARHLAHALSKTRSLAHLDVSCNAFGAKGVVLLARALEHNESLVSLCFSDNVVEDAGAATALLKAVGGHPSLETARFQACFPSGHTAIAMAAAELIRSTETISTLDLVSLQCVHVEIDSRVSG
jgi:Ran GTPase-activating protein (RanGAP) involved in mRNA processing and transport